MPRGQFVHTVNDIHAGPIRSYAETVAAMRERGDTTITSQQIYWYEKSAFRKLKPLLEQFANEIGDN
jgi:hypothetical protein